MKLVPAKKMKVLDFDIENRPLSYGGMDFTFSDITAIAASFEGEEEVHVWLLGEHSYKQMLLGFKKLYDQADMVTGHYIRRHDLPIINGGCLEFRLEPLGPKLTSCTKEDLVRSQGVSKSQESLSSMYELPEPKHHMDQNSWRMANRLTKKGILLTKKRVVDDILQHKALRKELIKNNQLKPGRMWNG